MWNQIQRVSISFALMLVVYFVYTVTLVPMIEPTINRNGRGAGTADNFDFVSEKKQQLGLLFPPDSWQMGPTKVLESSNIMLLMKDFREVGENRLQLEPLTILAFDTDEGREKWEGPIMVLNAERAVLEFTELNLAFGRIGELVGGNLVGEVRISRENRGDADPLEIETSDVRLATDRVETTRPVKFRLGDHHGSGRHLIARFEEGPRKAEQKGPNISGLSSLELVQVERILLAATGQGLFGDGKAKAEQPQAAGETPKPAPPRGGMYDSAPIEIRSRGPFLFDGTHRIATFRDQVDVRRLVDGQQPDRLRSDLLEIHFEASAAEAGPLPEDSTESMKGMKISRVVAVGKPFRLTAPSVESTATGAQLIYDLGRDVIEVRGSPSAVLTKGDYRIQSPNLQYEFAESSSRLGRVWSAGPGVFTGALPQKDETAQPDPVTISWSSELRIEQQNLEYIAAVVGDAVVQMDRQGRVNADQLFVWLRDETQGDDAQTLVPDRLRATGNVQLDTPQATGSTRDLKAWFQYDKLKPLPEDEGPPGLTTPGQVAGGPNRSRGPGRASGPSAAEEEQPLEGRYHMDGDQVQLVLRNDGEATHLENVTVTGNVKLSEILASDQKNLAPMMIRGNAVQLVRSPSRHATIHIVGNPGVVEGRGVQLLNKHIQIDQRQGRIWSDGKGELVFPLERDFQGRKLAVPEFFTVQWQGGMEIQRDQVVFDRAVHVQGRQQQLDTARMTITLSQALDFENPGENRNIAARAVECSNGVKIYNRTVEGREIKSVDQFDAKSLRIDQFSGDIYAAGPGTAKSVVRGGGAMMPGARPAEPPVDQSNQLTFIRVDFVSHMSGNLHKREVTFHGVDRAIYGPVADWDKEINATSAASLGPDDVTLRSEKLTLVQLPNSSTAENQGMELIAANNVEVQGRLFTAWADQISYATAKDLLILRGNGRNAAQLSHQKHIGGSRQTVSAGVIRYWPKQRELNMDDGKFIDITNLPGMSPERSPLR
ncbi:MAG: hypothetical protein WDZ51_18320 [Pirellulaceae bacterium]